MFTNTFLGILLIFVTKNLSTSVSKSPAHYIILSPFSEKIDLNKNLCKTCRSYFSLIAIVPYQSKYCLSTFYGQSKPQNTAQEMKFSITDFFSKCDQICWKLQIWPYLLTKYIMENFTFCVVKISSFVFFKPHLHKALSEILMTRFNVIVSASLYKRSRFCSFGSVAFIENEHFISIFVSPQHKFDKTGLDLP